MSTTTVLLGPQPLPDEDLPETFRIFASGWTDTSKGKFLFDERSAKSVMLEYESQGNELCIDYDHKAVDPDARAGDGRAAGWFTIALGEQGGLWATGVRWTPPAAKMLANREYRYFSPAFVADVKSKRILQLVNVALTNIPATKGMKPLVAATAVPFSGYPVVTDEWDAKAALVRVRHWASTNGQKHKALIDWDQYAKAFAWFDETKKGAFGAYALLHHDVRNGRLVTSREGVIAAGAALSRGVGVPPSELDAVRAHLARHYRQFDLAPPWEPSQEKAIMADKQKTKKPPEAEEMAEDVADDEEELADDAEEEEEAPESEDEEELADEDVDSDEESDEDEPDEGGEDEEEGDESEETPDEEEAPPKAKKQAARLSILRAAQEFTGKSKPSEIIGVLRAHRAAHEQVTKLSIRLKSVEGELRTTKVRSLVGRAVRAGKISPAMRKWALGLGTKDIAQLRAYIEKAPSLVQMDQATKPPPAGAGAEVVTLSAEELRVCELTQVSPADFARNKATGRTAIGGAR